MSWINDYSIMQDPMDIVLQFLNKLTTNKISRKQLARGECSLGS